MKINTPVIKYNSAESDSEDDNLSNSGLNKTNQKELKHRGILR